jgi:hypothetical protein
LYLFFGFFPAAWAGFAFSGVLGVSCNNEEISEFFLIWAMLVVGADRLRFSRCF